MKSEGLTYSEPEQVKALAFTLEHTVRFQSAGFDGVERGRGLSARKHGEKKCEIKRERGHVEVGRLIQAGGGVVIRVPEAYLLRERNDELS